MHVSHTGENIAVLLNEAVTEWGLGAKDPVVVTDNASSMTVAAFFFFLFTFLGLLQALLFIYAGKFLYSDCTEKVL